MVIDRRDRAEEGALAALGCRAIIADTHLSTPATAARVAQRLLAAYGLA
jgi:hypothetical protein